MKRKEKTSPWATITTQAVRGKREKLLVPWSPRNTLKKEKKTQVEGIKFLERENTITEPLELYKI